MEKGLRRARIVGLAVVLGILTNPDDGAAQPAEKLNLTTELAALGRAMPAIETFDADATALTARGSVSRTEIERLRAEAAAIKPHLPAMHTAFTGIIAKLKRVGKWTAESDVEMLASLRRSGDPQIRQIADAFVKAGGGRAYLEQAASRIPGLGSELDALVKSLEPKSVWLKILEPLLGTPVCACATHTARCYVKIAYYSVKWFVIDAWNAIT